MLRGRGAPVIRGRPRNATHIPFAQNRTGSDCPHLPRPVDVRNSQTFLTVDGATQSYVFSAILDRQEKLVRVIGLALNSRSTYDGVRCHLWYENGTEGLVVVMGEGILLPESKSRKYSASYVQCHLPDLREPYAVSVTSRDCSQQPTNVLPVIKSPPGGYSSNFTVCVKPINFYYSRAYELVEFIELNRMLGADKLVFYIFSVGPNAESVLRWYETVGIVELVDWKLPSHIIVRHWPITKGETEEIHAFGQIGSSNDCLHRHRDVSRYVIAKDLDEFIVPKKHNNWWDMIRHIDNKTGRPISSYVFRNLFFRKDWGVNEEDFEGKALAQRYMSVVLLTDKREPKPLPAKTRSKFIVDPQRVQTLGIHSVWKTRGTGSLVHSVDQEDGLVYHYRNWEKPEDRKNGVRDLDMMRFRQELLRRLEERWAQLPNVRLDVPQPELIKKYGRL
nr:hypothetical protein BaRGS_029816 [Batillaria attramentaria]